MSNRTLRVNELIQREISAILRKHYQSESVAITITDVRVSPDLHDGRVAVSILGDEATVQQRLRWLRSIAPAIRMEVGRHIVLKHLPKFEYVLDKSVGRHTRLLEVLDQIAASEKPKPPETPEQA
jgi:ribosome-binding factor A